MRHKTCNRCNTNKPISEFGPHKAKADGYLNQCRVCVRLWNRSYRDMNRDAIRNRQYRWRKTVENKIKVLMKLRERRANSPEKTRAHNLTWKAIARGELKPWPRCAMPDCDNKPQAHHPTYSEPLSVVWLCPIHHMQTHALARECCS